LNLSDNRTAPGEDGFTSSRPTPEAGDQDDKAFVDLFKRALNASSTYQGAKLTPAWGRNYRAYANRHFTGSKYDTPRYRNRSKLFKPKTRMAVRKNDATAAGALFSTETGQMIALGAACSMAMGVFIMNRIATIKV